MRRPYFRGPTLRAEITRKHSINEEITAREVRVIDAGGEQLGVISIDKALSAAQAREMDLVLIAPQAKPPVCKIIDYGKFIYEQQKREKIQKKAQQNKELKEIRLRAGTDTHDLEFKTRHAREFLENGHKVKATVFFRGREIVHKEIGREILVKFLEILEDVSKIDQDIRSEGRVLSVTIAPEIKEEPKKKKKTDDESTIKTENAQENAGDNNDA